MSQGYREHAIDTEWRNLYSSIFEKRPSEARRFINENWTEALFPEYILLMDEADPVLEELVAMMRAEDDNEVMVTSPETEPQFQNAFIVDTKISALAEVFYEVSIGHFDHVAFGRSGSWGMFCSNDLSFSALGGKKSIMQGLFDKLGGEEAVKSRFLTYWSNEMDVDDTAKQLLLDSAGWRWEQ